VTLFTKRDGQLKTWSDLTALKPLKVCSLERGTAAFVAEQMVGSKGGIPIEVTTHDVIPGIVEDVMSGRCAAGIVSTNFLIERLDQLQPIVSFGAARNGMLGETPTFAEVTGKPKLAFTESIGVFASPTIDPAVAAVLTKAFLAAGQEREVLDGAEAKMLPLAIGTPEVLIETMKRNERLLAEILG
jgi:tripartite-type tricarboxylate transporter receptor subunit TctC